MKDMNEMKQTIRELPESSRPYEKCLQWGPSVLSDSELLAVIAEKRCTRLQFSCTRQSNLKSYERYLLSGTSGTFTYVHSGSDEGERNRDKSRPSS